MTDDELIREFRDAWTAFGQFYMAAIADEVNALFRAVDERDALRKQSLQHFALWTDTSKECDALRKRVAELEGGKVVFAEQTPNCGA